MRSRSLRPGQRRARLGVAEGVGYWGPPVATAGEVTVE